MLRKKVESEDKKLELQDEEISEEARALVDAQQDRFKSFGKNID